MTGDNLTLCVIGAGPRGLSVLERLCANARAAAASGSPRAVAVHLVDPGRPGSGGVWRTGQSSHLLMNTVASQITMFTDAGVRIAGPLEPGPSLYGWARSRPHAGAAVRAEARRLGPDSYPTRAFYGHYLEWVFRRVVRRAPTGVSVHLHRARAVALDDAGGPARQTVRLDDGTLLDGLDAVVLCQGHLPTRPTDTEAELSSYADGHGLLHVPPANPADADLSAVRPGEPVLLRGLGLTFFDHVALLTEGRGGTFERTGGSLVYRPSGREPLLHAGSRRGVPYHARGENEKGAHGRHRPRLLTPLTLARLRGRADAGRRLDFRADLWPLIAKETECVYYEALLRRRGTGAGELAEFADRYLAAPRGAAERDVLARCGIGRADRWDWDRLARPCAGLRFAGPGELRSWLLDRLARDVAEARAGNVSGPLKAALDVLRDLRNEIRQLVDHGGLLGDSHRDDLDGWYTPLNAFLSIGPPAHRIERMAALIEAGILSVAGPGARVRTEAGAFVLESEVPGAGARGRVLIEARLPEPDLARTADPLLRHLLATGQCRAHRIPCGDGTDYVTGGLAVTGRPCHLLDATGRPHPRRFALGVPTESVHWVTAAGIRPGVDSMTLGDSDTLARALLGMEKASDPRFPADQRLLHTVGTAGFEPTTP
ncbi:FAD/NAD(P)-binding protein [Streptomyces sp. NPDC037389]|uniref:FAD/NAD(P)-binding protein n=1 Tax=Streptomyces sp. NPDC037389 TaxID=3155369 RepID=UPI00340268DA